MELSFVGGEAAGMGGQTPSAAPHARTHAVQFYESEGFLYDAVARFVAAGLENGQPAMLVGTPVYRERVLAGLRTRGVDTERAGEGGRLALLDARETLDALLDGGLPDADAFRALTRDVFEQRLRGHAGVVCVHGELVELLWREGNPEAALRLEALWNELAGERDLSVLCTYAIGNFTRAEDGERFGELCRLHQQVVPTERYAAACGAERLREVSALQQRAHALETELEYRRELEARLREVLAGQEALLAREREARSEAEEANRAKRDFLAMMSHELRTPLNAIAGYAELMELEVYGPVSEAQRQSLARIRRGQQQLLNVIDEVLVYARSESGRIRYAVSEVNLHDVLRALKLEVAAETREREIRFSCPATDPPLRALADRTKLLEILLNLVGNALAFTPAGGCITVECAAAGSEVRVDVHDTGTGIPADKTEAVFQPFFQVDAGLTRRHQGTGLGLAISREYARGMGGEVAVTRSGPDGTTFTLTLPRVAD